MTLVRTRKTSGGFKQLFVVCTLQCRDAAPAAVEAMKPRHRELPTIVLKEFPCMLSPTEIQACFFQISAISYSSHIEQQQMPYTLAPLCGLVGLLRTHQCRWCLIFFQILQLPQNSLMEAPGINHVQ